MACFLLRSTFFFHLQNDRSEKCNIINVRGGGGGEEEEEDERRRRRRSGGSGQYSHKNSNKFK